MYECLRQNLELDSKGGRGIYFFIDRGLDIHLGVADKALLLRRWKEFDYSCFDDLWRDTFHTLVENGYTSTKIECVERFPACKNSVNQQFKLNRFLPDQRFPYNFYTP